MAAAVDTAACAAYDPAMRLAYLHGVSDVPLRGETIGEAWRAIGRRARRGRRARLAPPGHPLDLRRARRAGRALRAGAARAGGREGRPRRHLVAEQRRVGRRPVRDGADRRDPRQHQPGLSRARARVRAAAVRLLAADPRAGLQGRRLRRAARARRRRAGAARPGRAARREWDALLARADDVPAEALRAREAELQFDEPINIQYTSGTTGFPKGATLRTTTSSTTASSSARRSATRRPTASASRCRSTTASGWCSATSRSSRTAPASSSRPRRSSRGATLDGGRGGALHVALRRADDVHRRARPTRSSPSSTSRRCGRGSWPARPARSR